VGRLEVGVAGAGGGLRVGADHAGPALTVPVRKRVGRQYAAERGLDAAGGACARAVRHSRLRLDELGDVVGRAVCAEVVADAAGQQVAAGAQPDAGLVHVRARDPLTNRHQRQVAAGRARVRVGRVQHLASLHGQPLHAQVRQPQKQVLQQPQRQLYHHERHRRAARRPPQVPRNTQR